jgi:hypothetical protein
MCNEQDLIVKLAAYYQNWLQLFPVFGGDLLQFE